MNGYLREVLGGVALSEPDCLIIHFASKNSFLEEMPPIIVF
jgi:hypothetical protein